MTQPNVDDKFLSGLHLMIDSIESSYLQKADDDDDVKERVSHNGDRSHLPKEKRPLDTTISGGGEVKHQPYIQHADEDDLPKADPWCPDVQEWHTSEHKPAQAPSVHVNVDSDNGDDPYHTENGSDTGAWDDSSDDDDDDLEKISVAATLKDVEHGRDRIESEYDQNTNLDRHHQENSPDSIAEPFLNRYETTEDEDDEEEDDDENSVKKSNEFIKSLYQTHAKSIDILKIWGSVDRVLPKTSSDTQLVTDIDILKSFNLDETTNIEELIEGTLVHKMLIERSSRPTMEWWESSMLIAKSIDVVDEPAFFSAFLYYEPDTFDITDFIELNKAEITRGKPQDLEMMPNSSGGSAMEGLGMSADGHHGPEDDKDCD